MPNFSYRGVDKSGKPVAGQMVTTATPATAPPPASAPVPAPETFEQLLERFLTAARQLPGPQRPEVAKRLGEEGLAWMDNDKVVLEVTDELRQGLGLPADQQPRLRNLVQLCVVLVEAFHKGEADLLTMHSSDEATDLIADGYAVDMRPWTRNESFCWRGEDA
jgi:hypothetical protein